MRYSILAIVTTMFLCSGCTEQSSYRSGTSITGSIAVIPFELLSGDPNGGITLAGYIEDELHKTGVKDVLSREHVAAKLAQLEGEVKTPAELGTLLGVDKLLIGKVTEYRYRQGVGEEPVVGANLRLVEAATGRVLWSTSISDTGRYSFFANDTLSRLAQNVAEKAVSDLLKDNLRGN